MNMCGISIISSSLQYQLNEGENCQTAIRLKTKTPQKVYLRSVKGADNNSDLREWFFTAPRVLGFLVPSDLIYVPDTKERFEVYEHPLPTSTIRTLLTRNSRERFTDQERRKRLHCAVGIVSFAIALRERNYASGSYSVDSLYETEEGIRSYSYQYALNLKKPETWMISTVDFWVPPFLFGKPVNRTVRECVMNGRYDRIVCSAVVYNLLLGRLPYEAPEDYRVGIPFDSWHYMEPNEEKVYLECYFLNSEKKIDKMINDPVWVDNRQCIPDKLYQTLRSMIECFSEKEEKKSVELSELLAMLKEWEQEIK